MAGFAVAYLDPQLARGDAILGALLESWRPLALSMTVAVVVPMVFYAMAGVLLFVRKGNDWVALLTSLGFITAGATVARPLAMLMDRTPATIWIVRPIWTIALVSATLIAFLFPDGRFVPRWTRVATPIAILVLFVFPGIPIIIGRSEVLAYEISSWYQRGAIICALAYTALGITAQGIRYRRIIDPTERRRFRRVVFSIGFFVALMGTNWVLHLLAPGVAIQLLPVIVLVGVLPAVFTSLSVVDIVVRGGLFDMDTIANRTLVYGAVTALLGACYAAAILLLNRLFAPLTSGSDLSVALATVLTASFGRPVFRRVRDAVERRFNRSRYDASRTIEAFTHNLRRQLDLDAMGAGLVDVVHRTMHPTSAWIWWR